MQDSLKHKRVLVTGAASGIGNAVALRFAASSARLGLVDVDAAGLSTLEADLNGSGGSAVALAADVGIEADMAGAVDTMIDRWGGIDVVVGVAGIELSLTGDARVGDLDLHVWQRIMGTNLTGMFLTCKHGIRGLSAAGGGAVILTGSPCAITGKCGSEHAYSASKAGVHGLVRVMAADYASENIRVNAVIPGLTDTALCAHVLSDPVATAQAMATIPLRRPGQPRDVAGIYAWLASDEAAYVTGGFFPVDGGLLAV